MSELSSYYLILFHAVTNAIQALEACNFGEAKQLLLRGQQDAEDAFIEESQSPA